MLSVQEYSKTKQKYPLNELMGDLNWLAIKVNTSYLILSITLIVITCIFQPNLSSITKKSSVCNKGKKQKIILKKIMVLNVP